MKQKNLKLGLAGTLVLWLAISIFSPKHAMAETPYGVSFQVFYDELMPYGDWVKDANYGYIWLPAAGNDFHPYGSNGHWVMTEYGNTWVSYYDWGWAPFHYGRWYFDDYYQSWAWIPGYDWGPAWVNWRTGGGHYGWAPMGPGVSISVRVNIPSFHWVFLPSNRIYHPYAYNYYAPYKSKVKIYNNTTIINNTVVYNNNRYVSGPNRREVERATRQVVPVYSVKGSNAPGRSAVSRNGVELYRPDLSASRGRTVESRPSRVSTPDQVKNSRAQSRNTYSNSPSRNARSESSSSPANRSSSASDRSNSRSNTSTPSRTNAGSRSATTPSRNGSVESRTYEQKRTNAGSTSTRTQSSSPQSTRSNTKSAPSNSSTRGKVTQPTTRTQQTTPQRGRSTTPTVRKSTGSSSNGRVSQPTQTRKSSPTVRSSSSSQSRSTSSTPKATSRTTTTKKSSSASTQRSSTSRRGNNI